MSANQLNKAQYQAVFHRGGPLLVLAGAGSGKTRVITERIAALVERDVPEDAITAVTFTNKAAREMRQRLATRLGEKAERLRICTFHALGLAMLREHADLIGRRDNVSVFAGAEQRSALRGVLQEMRLPSDAEQVQRLLDRVSRLKSGLDAGDDAIEAIRQRYDVLLERMNAVDFDDLMILPIRLLTGHSEVRALWRERARHFLVDEYQDSSRVQYDLVRLLVPGDGNLTVVGDDDQSIYGWRGAEVRNLFQLETDYPGLKVVRLEENYRSTGMILHAANSLIAHNSERLGKTLRSTLGSGKSVRIWQAANPDEEAERVSGDIRAQRASGGLQWSDFCILYRASYQSRPLEMALRTAGVPYHVTGGPSFFDRAEVQDVLAYLRLIANVADDLAFMRAVGRPRRGIGDKALGELGEFALNRRCSLLEACRDDGLAHRLAPTLRGYGEMIMACEHLFLHAEPDDAFDHLLNVSGLGQAVEDDAEDEVEAERRLANVHDLRRWWLRHAGDGGSLAEFLQRIFLLADKEDKEPEGQVRLMTVHAAKGLEFGQVYVVGMEDGTFPHRSALEEKRMEEERRLMYVAMTRARFCLTLSYAQARRRYGQVEKMLPSPFLHEPDQQSVRWADQDNDSAEAKEEIEDHMEAMRRSLGIS